MAVESINKKPRSLSGALFFCHPQTFFYYCHVRPFFLTVMFGLVPNIHRHKALAHDIYIESNALRQRFAPQPVLRPSWQQLVMFGLDPDIQP